MGVWRMLNQNTPIILSIILGLSLSFLVTRYLNENCQVGSLLDVQDNALRSDEFEPKINFAGKPQRAKKVPKNLVRPRYYSTELGIRQRLFMGVMTTEKTVGSLALAVNRTSLPYLNKIMFFLDAVGAENARASDLKLPGIIGFKDTKENLKPFHVIKYLTDNFLEEFDFFFISKDTTYVNARQLETIIKKISVSEHIHAGGKPAGEGSPFCSLDGGILLSNSVLKKIRPSLDWCVKNSFSDSHDANVGRCILHASQLPCVQMVQGNVFESVFLKPEDESRLESLDLGSSLSYYPISDPNVFYKLHMMFCKKHLLQVRDELARLEEKFDKKDSAWPPGSYPPMTPPTRFDLLAWQHFDLDNIYLPSDFQNYKPLIGPDRQDILNALNKSVDWVMSRYPSELHFRRLVNGYRRFDASRGLDYILDLGFKDNTGKEVVKRIEVSKPLGKVELLPMPYVTESTRIFMLLPVQSNDNQPASEFMKKYSNTCSQTDLTFLLLILLYEPRAPGKGHEADVFKEIKALATDLSSKKHRDCKIAWISIRLPEVDHKAPLEDHLTYFAMTDLVSKKLSQESLILFTEPNMELRSDYLNRVRMGTITGKQVYSPIPFTEYNPEIVFRNVSQRNTVLEIHKNSGRFDIDNTRHLSFYLNDYTAARSNITYLPVVKSDKDIAKLFYFYKESKETGKVKSLLDLFSRQDMNVLRTTEPSLKLHRADCHEIKTDIIGPTEYSRCSSPMATRSQLGQIVLDYKDKLRTM
ncbi:chondroitin sulfate synthase 2 [Cimex lectularius]|uniref:Hexosyltransferase n=1 Tax=Cimex lectularius TaxID=79782 RepID=A0A8I6RB25_CIMLE|nr:chondroitin sulfate synthase 2 [Cimex lectularius]